MILHSSSESPGDGHAARDGHASRQWRSAAMGVAGALAIGWAGLALTGCNTTEGVGEDIEAAGGAIDDAAEDTN